MSEHDIIDNALIYARAFDFQQSQNIYARLFSEGNGKLENNFAMSVFLSKITVDPIYLYIIIIVPQVYERDYHTQMGTEEEKSL